MSDHEVTRRGARGEPRQLVCLAHEGCTWRRDVADSTNAGDAIARSLLGAHLRERAVPVPPMMGHPKRARV